VTQVIDAWHLPLLEEGEAAGFEERTLHGGDFIVRTPALRPGTLTRYAGRLKQARLDTLVHRSTGDLVRLLAAAADRLRAELRREPVAGALAAATGFSEAMAEHILDGMARDWTADALHALVAAEFGGGEALDGFVAHGRGRVRALGAPLVLHVFAGNVPGVPVTSLMRASLVKSASLAKTASGEPLLAPLFAKAVHALDPAVGACLAVTTWHGGDEAVEDEAFSAAELAVVYGGADTIRAIRRRAPAQLTLVEHGPKISFGVVGAGVLENEAHARAAAAEVAGAVASFDQHGCVSPQLVYVEAGGAVVPRAFAKMIADELTVAAATLPRGRLDHADAAALRELSASAEFRALRGGDIDFFDATDGVVIYDGESPLFEGSCLNRSLRVKPVKALEQVPELAAPFRDVLQSAAICGVAEGRLDVLAEALAAAGVTRITSFGALPWPPSTWHHDGRGPLRELVRMVDFEG
jgi:hypothetical protein